MKKQSIVSDAPYSLCHLGPGLLIFVIILRVGNCRSGFFVFYKKKKIFYLDCSSVSFGRRNRFLKPPYFVQTLTHIKNNRFLGVGVRLGKPVFFRSCRRYSFYPLRVILRLWRRYVRGIANVEANFTGKFSSLTLDRTCSPKPGSFINIDFNPNFSEKPGFFT